MRIILGEMKKEILFYATILLTNVIMLFRVELHYNKVMGLLSIGVSARTIKRYREMMKILRFLSIFGMMVVTGCSIFPEAQPDIPVSYFDIGTPLKIVETGKSNKIDIQDVRTTDPYNERMVFRSSDTHLQIDDYNRWASAPNEMFKNYFILAFNDGNLNKLHFQDENRLELYITIMCLEADLRTREVRLAMFVEVKQSQLGSQLYTEIMSDSAKVDTLSAESFASTAKILTDRMINSLAKNIHVSNFRSR